jgi:branched-chain amino acid transport system ATP-binding protein
LNTGDALGIIGPNGAGKTSLFNIITGTVPQDGGSIYLQNKNIDILDVASRNRRGIARSFQIPQPFSGMTVLENVLVSATQGGNLTISGAKDFSIHILVITGLFPKANRLAGDLTLLERKRLELAKALATKPKVLLLDEIAGGLTEHECQALIVTVKNILKEEISIIWIEHVVHALLLVIDRLLVLDFGIKVAEGDPSKIMKSEVVQKIYLGIDADV